MGTVRERVLKRCLTGQDDLGESLSPLTFLSLSQHKMHMFEKISEYLFMMLEFILIWNKIYSTIRNKFGTINLYVKVQ